MTVVLYTQYWIITLSWNHHFCGQQIVLWSWDDLSFVSVKEPWLTVGYISTRGQHILASFNLCPSSRAAQKDTADFCHNTLTRMLPNLFPLIKVTSSVLQAFRDARTDSAFGEHGALWQQLDFKWRWTCTPPVSAVWSVWNTLAKVLLQIHTAALGE